MATEFEDLELRMADPVLIADQTEYQKLLKRRRELQNAVELFYEQERLEKQIADNEGL